MPTTIDCDPNALLDAAKCFKCIPKGLEPEVMIYLLNVISGLNLTPQQLMTEAKCYKCIPKGMQEAVMTFLLCNIATTEAGG